MLEGSAELNRVTGAVIDAGLRLHRTLGPGLLESVYVTIMARDLARMGFEVEQQKSVSFEFEGLWFSNAFRADLVVAGSVVVEVKSIAALAPIHERQLLTYLRLLDCPVGLLMNFGADRLKNGLKRIINTP